jgi:hypothetical protein
VLKLFGQNFAETNGTFRVELHDSREGYGEVVVGEDAVSGERNGRNLSNRYRAAGAGRR